MRVAVRRLRVDDAAKLQALVVENFDAIEPGLTVLDARLLLGHATIDVIGVDAVGALVLGAVGATANEEMLLKAVEAYSWCLEYPEALVRLYPSCQVSEDRPPRLLFVVERMPDAFHRKIKQLGFPEVDCVEFRYLEFDGTQTVYFESLLRLRRPAIVAASRIVEPESPAPTASGSSTTGDKVVTMNAAGAARPIARSPRLAAPAAPDAASTSRLLDRGAAAREAAAVVTMASRPAAAPTPAPAERPRPAAQPTVQREPEPLAMADPAAALELDPIVASLCESVAEPELSTAPATPSRGGAEPPTRPLAVDAVPAIAPSSVPTAAVPAPERVSFKDLATALLGATTETQEALASAVATTTPKPSPSPVPAATPVELVLESRSAQPVEAPKPTSIELEAAVRSAGTSTAQPAKPRVERPASPASPAEPAKPAAPAMPQGFEGLKFPNDGVLTRQWMEFLSQMSGTK